MWRLIISILQLTTEPQTTQESISLTLFERISNLIKTEGFVVGISTGLIVAGILYIFSILPKLLNYLWLVRRKRLVTKRKSQVLPKYSYQWLIDYYAKKDRINDLYVLECKTKRRYLPFLTRKEWHCGSFQESELIRLSETAPYSTKSINNSLLRKKSNYMDLDWKGEVWNEEIMCVHRIRDGLTPRIELCIASYYQFLSACGALEEETYSVIDNPRRIARLRNQYASSLDELIRCGLGAHGFGMQVAFVYANQNEKNMILIQRRELAVSIYGGARAVVPMFGCQPHKDRSKVSMSLKHNFLREYYEELYGADEMIRTNQEYLSYSWFYNEEPVSELIRLIDTGEANITILGFGYDALNCECDIAVLVYIANKDFINNQIRTMKRNWEIEKIESVMLFSEELDNMLYNLEFQPGSAFAIAEARKHLLSIGKNQ